MILLLAATAFAQSSEPVELQDGVQIIYKRTTEIEFEGIGVDAAVARPDGILVLEPPRAEFNPLIVLRDHFNEEMASSIQDVR